MPKTFRTLSSLIVRAVTRPGDRFVGEAGRRILAAATFALVGGAVFVGSLRGERFVLAVTAGWGAAAACYLLLAWAFMLRTTPGQTRAWALAQDTDRSRVLRGMFGRVTGLGVVVFATVAGFLLATGLLEGSGLLRVLSGVSVMLTWLLLQTSYGLHYAHLYYRRSGTPDGHVRAGGGLEFPGEDEPGLTDFAYFAFAVSTAFAVSDVRVTSTSVRRVVIGHSLLSFAYNAAILTLAFGTVVNADLG